MCIYRFVILPSAAIASMTTDAIQVIEAAVALANVRDITKHRNGTPVDRSLRVLQVHDHEERAGTPGDFSKIKSLAGCIAMHARIRGNDADADSILKKLTEVKHVEGLAELYMNQKYAATLETSLARGLADAYGDNRMAQALVRASMNREPSAGSALEKVQDAMTARWNLEKYTPEDILRWLEKDKTISDEDLFRPAATKLLDGANLDFISVDEALWNHFHKNAARFSAALLRAEEKDIGDISYNRAIKARWDGLLAKNSDMRNDPQRIPQLLHDSQEKIEFVPGESFQSFQWLTPAEKEKIKAKFTSLQVE